MSMGKKLSGKKIVPFLLRLTFDMMVCFIFADYRRIINALLSFLYSAKLVFNFQLHKQLYSGAYNFTHHNMINCGFVIVLGKALI